MNFPRTSLLLSVLLLVSASLRADVPGNALSLFDRYLADASKTEARYRTDVKVRDPGDPPEAGRFTANGPFAGPFTYRPITYRELSIEQRSALLADPKFRAWMDSQSPKRKEITLSLDPDQFLKPGPLVISVPDL